MTASMSPIALIFVLLASAAAVSATPTPTPYEVLRSFNLPIGVLPQGSLGYDLDPGTGKFSAYLNGSCSFSLEGSYQLRYQPTISGVISPNRLRNLSGVSVKVLFLWINIIEVNRRGDQLEFSVGIASADFPVDNFDICPKCGCGVDCLSLPGGEEKGATMKLRGAF